MSEIKHPAHVAHHPHGAVRSVAAGLRGHGTAASFSAMAESAWRTPPGGVTAHSFPHNAGPVVAASPATAGGNSFIAAHDSRFIGRATGSGQCVALVHAACPTIGATHTWVSGKPVQGDVTLQPGTVIATFGGSGRYANANDGSSHAAIYLGQNAQGVQVLDQWEGRPAAVRNIPWSNPGATAANTGSAFRVVLAG